MKLGGKLWCIVGVELFIVNERRIVTQRVEIKIIWSAVMMVECVGKNLYTVTECLVHRSPHPFHGLLSKSFFFVLVIQASKEEGVEANFGKETGVSV